MVKELVNESVIGQVKGRKQIGDWSKDVVVKVLGVRIEPKYDKNVNKS